MFLNKPVLSFSAQQNDKLHLDVMVNHILVMFQL